MGKSLEQLRLEAEAADRAYREAAGNSEDRLNAIAREQDRGIRPEYRREEARDEHGNPIKLDKFGNPEWRGGQKIEAARARPVYTPPLRSPYSEPSAPPPDVDFKGSGTWGETEDLWRDLADLLIALENDKHAQAEREEIVQQIVPSLLDRLAQVAPRIDCAFADSPMGKGAWFNLVSRYQAAFNPSKTLERSIGSMRSRRAPQFLSFATEGAKWLFRRCPNGIPKLEYRVTGTDPASNPDGGFGSDAPKRKPGRPKKTAEEHVSNVE